MATVTYTGGGGKSEPAGVIAATAAGGLQHGCRTTVGGLSEGYCRGDPQCLDHHNPPPMEKQKRWGQGSGLADLQEKIDTHHAVKNE